MEIPKIDTPKAMGLAVLVGIASAFLMQIYNQTLRASVRQAEGTIYRGVGGVTGL